MVDRRKPAHGFSDWAWQRATAITMLIYSIIILVRFVIDPPASGAAAWPRPGSSRPFPRSQKPPSACRTGPCPSRAAARSSTPAPGS